MALGEARYNFRMAGAGSGQSTSVVDIPKRGEIYRRFKALTGTWPVYSVVFYAGRFVLMLGIISFLFWYGHFHSTEANRITLYALIGMLPVIFLWNVLEIFVWNYELRRRGLIAGRTYLSLRQIPDIRGKKRR